jgi:predicted nucleotidyltransferase
MEHVAIDNTQIESISREIVRKINPEKVILFGSYACGNQTTDSDVDLIIISNTNLPKHKRSIEIRRLFYRKLIPMDIKVYTPEEFEKERLNKFSFLNTLLKQSKVLYDRQA